jgi:hypothetical protein
VVHGTGVGIVHEDLKTAVMAAIVLPRQACRNFAQTFSWQSCAEQFLDNLAPFSRG